MYTLRTFQEQIQHNESLGNEYHVVHRETSYDDFCVAYNTFFGQGHVAEVVGIDNRSDFPLKVSNGKVQRSYTLDGRYDYNSPIELVKEL